MKKVELLAPAGNLEKLKIAFLYGADAVYIGGESFSLRTACENFSYEEMKEGICFAHDMGKKVYITANIIPHNKDMEEIETFAKEVRSLGADGVIISDLGVFSIFKEYAPDIEIHISTQANNVNYKEVQMWGNLGAKRVVLARELTLSEIEEIRNKTSPEIELEAFVHGAMCISYSGRCLLSNYMTNRNSNEGACSHPCRWNYSLVEEKRPGEYFPVVENERGTFIFNSKDLCMIEHIPELIKSGITSFKIEGRVKSEYYVATVVKAYRDAIDAYYENPDEYEYNPQWMEELCKVSHRPYYTGFFFGMPKTGAQVYESSSYIRDYNIVGMVVDYDEKTGIATVEQRNRIFKGDEIEILMPKGAHHTFKIVSMQNAMHEEIESAPHAQMILYIPVDVPVIPGSMLRKKR